MLASAVTLPTILAVMEDLPPASPLASEAGGAGCSLSLPPPPPIPLSLPPFSPPLLQICIACVATRGLAGCMSLPAERVCACVSRQQALPFHPRACACARPSLSRSFYCTHTYTHANTRNYTHTRTHTHTHTHTHTQRERARMHAHTHTYLRTCVDAGKFLNAEEREAKLKDQEGGPNWQTRNVRRLVLLEALDVHTYVYGDVLCMFGHSQNVWIYVSREGERTFSSLHSTEGEY